MESPSRFEILIGSVYVLRPGKDRNARNENLGSHFLKQNACPLSLLPTKDVRSVSKVVASKVTLVVEMQKNRVCRTSTEKTAADGHLERMECAYCHIVRIALIHQVDGLSCD